MKNKVNGNTIEEEKFKELICDMLSEDYIVFSKNLKEHMLFMMKKNIKKSQIADGMVFLCSTLAARIILEPLFYLDKGKYTKEDYRDRILETTTEICVLLSEDMKE